MRLWDDVAVIRRLGSWLFALAILCLFVAVGFLLLCSPLFPVKNVQIEGKLSQVSQAQLRYIAEHDIIGNIFTVDVHQVKEAFERLPWVKKADVRRIWPDKIEISVVERQALARWYKNGLIDTNGTWFDGNFDENLPVFIGAEGSEDQMSKMYQKLSPELSKTGLKINALELADRGAWQIKLDNGILVKLGRKDVLKRAQVLVEFWNSQLEQQQDNIEYIDLRYSNGFVVKSKL